MGRDLQAHVHWYSSFIKGVLDQDVPDTLLDRLPHLYAHGRLSQVYKPYSFWLNMVDAMYQSLVIFYVAYGAFAGSDVGIWEFGTVICTECLVVNSLHLAVNIRAWVSTRYLIYFVLLLLINLGLQNSKMSNFAVNSLHFDN